MRASTLCIAAGVGLGCAGAGSGFTSPEQPWASADGQVRLLRPASAVMSFSQEPLGSLMSAGWRLNWSGRPDWPGTMAARLALPFAPSSGTGQAVEVLQIGWSDRPEALRTCLTFGMTGAYRGKRSGPRVINGVRYAVFDNGDAGMSQNIDATDLRAVNHGRCYAVERYGYVTEAADRDPAVTLSPVRAAAMLDAALDSLRLGSDATPTSRRLHMPKGVHAYTARRSE